jgi:hypothetical protein
MANSEDELFGSSIVVEDCGDLVGTAEALQIIRDRLKASAGRAEKLLNDAQSSGEVRLFWVGEIDVSFNGRKYQDCGTFRAQLDSTGEVQLLGIRRKTDDDLRPRVMGCLCSNQDDLIDWLDRQHPQVAATEKEEASHRYRYPGDAALVEEGRQMIANGMTKSRAARELAPRAEGGNAEQREQRLRKLL